MINAVREKQTNRFLYNKKTSNEKQQNAANYAQQLLVLSHLIWSLLLVYWIVALKAYVCVKCLRSLC